MWRGVWNWDRQRLKELVALVGPKRLVLDLSCRKQDGVYKVNTAVYQSPPCLDAPRTLYTPTALTLRLNERPPVHRVPLTAQPAGLARDFRGVCMQRRW